MKNRFITQFSIIKAEVHLLWTNALWTKCDGCGHQEFYIKYKTISSQTNEWLYSLNCCYCGREIEKK